MKCECEDRGPEATRWHGGHPDGCPREAADHGNVIASPALCLPCLNGCFDDEDECPHDWTLRPESDTWVCEMCGAER